MTSPGSSLVKIRLLLDLLFFLPTDPTPPYTHTTERQYSSDLAPLPLFHKLFTNMHFVILSHPGYFIPPRIFYPTQNILSHPGYFIPPRIFYPTQNILSPLGYFIPPRIFYPTQDILSAPNILGLVCVVICAAVLCICRSSQWSDVQHTCLCVWFWCVLLSPCRLEKASI